MGVILSSVYQRKDLIISELSIRTPSNMELDLMEKAKKKWEDDYEQGKNIRIVNEGFIITISAEFQLEEKESANLFPSFVSDFIEEN